MDSFWNWKFYCYFSAACGGDISVNETEISSPLASSGMPYPDHSRCMWRIRAPSNMQVAFRFSRFDLETKGAYCYDMLSIYMGDSSKDLT